MRGILVFGSILVLSSTAFAQVELRNDGFDSGESVGFQAGFTANEIGASRFVAPEAGRQLLSVQLLFGGAGGSRDVTVKVWDDTAGGTSPGAELDSEDFTLTGSNDTIQEITLANTVIVPAQFRVGIVFHTGGLPSIARDDDGTITATRNYIYAPPSWHQSQEFLLTGDWVIRAFVSNGTGPQPDAAPGTPDAAPGTPDAATGGECNGNSECPVGQYCDVPNHSCTFDCRDENDCGGDVCNSLGQCVEGDGGGGCCQTDGGGSNSAGGVLLALGVLGLVVRRRRG
jgi:MYXO-CTERM domain-containing protein